MENAKVLVIDGDPKNLQILKDSLDGSGFQVAVTGNGAEAWSIIQNTRPDIIVSEVDIPGLDGFQLLDKLQRDPLHAAIPLVFLTNRRNLEDRIRSLSTGVKDYMVKPLHVKEVIARLHMILRRIERVKTDEAETTRKIVGRLEESSVESLVENYGVEKRTGVLSLYDRHNRNGEIFFRNGSVVNARLGNFKAEKAVYQMLPWDHGHFIMTFKDVNVDEEITVSNLGLLLQGFKRLQERERLVRRLPPLDTVFEKTTIFGEVLKRKDIGSDALRFISLIDGKRALSQIMADSTYDDLKTLERILRLYEQGFVQPVGGMPFQASMAEPDAEIGYEENSTPVSEPTMDSHDSEPLVEPNTSEDETHHLDAETDGPDSVELETAETEFGIKEPDSEDDESPVALDYAEVREAEDDEMSLPDAFSIYRGSKDEDDEFELETDDIASNKMTEHSLETEAFDDLKPDDIDSGIETEDIRNSEMNNGHLNDEQDFHLESTEEDDVLHKDLKNLDAREFTTGSAFDFEMREEAEPKPEETVSNESEFSSDEETFNEEAFDGGAFDEDIADPYKDDDLLESQTPSHIPKSPPPFDIIEPETELVESEQPQAETRIPVTEPEATASRNASTFLSHEDNDDDVETETAGEQDEVAELCDGLFMDQEVKEGRLIVVSGNNWTRKEFISTLTSGKVTSKTLGTTQDTIEVGKITTAQNRTLDVLGLSTERKFLQMLGQVAETSLAYVFLVVGENSARLRYLGYLINSLRGNINGRFIVAVYHPEDKRRVPLDVIRYSLNLDEAEQIIDIDVTSRKAMTYLLSQLQAPNKKGSRTAQGSGERAPR